MKAMMIIKQLIPIGQMKMKTKNMPEMENSIQSTPISVW